MNIQWNPPETAPLDRLLLGDFGWPWPLPCTWDAESESWATAALASEGKLGEVLMTKSWFETHYESPSQLKAWAEFPASQPRGQTPN